MRGNEQSPASLVIFTDLDGTLLDRRTYDHSEALPALELIRQHDIPLVFCSSKTRAEQEELRERMGLRDPFIVEDGAAVCIERGYCPFPYERHRSHGKYHIIELGVPYATVRRAIPAITAETGITLRGFGDLDAVEVAAMTGLDGESALRAKKREYEETLILDPSADERARLERACSMHGLTLTRGTRFFGMKGSHDKGSAVRILITLYRRRYGAVVSSGIGDGANDESLLAAVDRPYLVEREGGGWVEMPVPGITTVAGVGPVGWKRAVFELLD